MPHDLTSLSLFCLVLMAAVMAASWLFQLATKNTGWVDVFWTYGTGATAVFAALWPLDGETPTPASWLAAVMVGLWALRLGTYIAFRVADSEHEDTRYSALKAKWGKAFHLRLLPFVLVQAPVSTVLAFAVALAARSEVAPTDPRSLVAIALWVVAVVGESVADGQMKAFRARPENRGKVMDQGLWGLSRHPNYFFEWVVWWAYPVLAVDPARPVTWLSLGAPVVMFLILRFVTGVPPLERTMLASRPDAFRAYQARVNAFLPGPQRKASPSPESA